MDTRYVEPKADTLVAFLDKIKSKEGVSDIVLFMTHNLLSPLLDAKTPKAAQLFIGGLIWLSESEPVFEAEFLNQGLGITGANQLDDKCRIVYLAQLAEHLAVEENKSDKKKESKESKESKDFTFKEKVVSVASGVLDRIAFQATPLDEMREFKGISSQYDAANLNPGFFKRMRGVSPERIKQKLFIETLATLCADLTKQNEPYEYRAIMSAASLYVMFLIERSYPRGVGGGELYPLLQAKAQVGHSSEVDLAAQKLLFDELFRFLEKTTIEQWKKSRPADAKNFDIAKFLQEMHEKLPLIKLCENKPTSMPYYVARKTTAAAALTVGWARSSVLSGFAEELHLVYGFGKNSFILTIASGVAESLSSCAGAVGRYIVKPTVMKLGQTAEKNAAIFSITDLPGMVRDGYAYLTAKNSEPEVYEASSDPFNSLLNLFLMHAKAQKEQREVEFFQAAITVYDMFPDEVKQRMAQRAQLKVVKPEVEPEAVLTEKSDEELLSEFTLVEPEDTASAPSLSPRAGRR